MLKGLSKNQEEVLKTVLEKKKDQGYRPRSTSKKRIEAAEFLLKEGLFYKEGKTYYLNEAKREEANELLKVQTSVQIGLLPSRFNLARPILEDFMHGILRRLDAIELSIQGKQESLKMKINEEQLPQILKLVYNQVNSEEPRFASLIPLSYIKPRIFERYEISNAQVNRVLLELEKSRKIDLQVAYDSSKVKNPEYGMNLPGRGLVFFVRWRTR